MVPGAASSHNAPMTPQAPDDPVTLVAKIAESLPTLDADQLERLAQALDELTEAVGLALEVGDP